MENDLSQLMIDYLSGNTGAEQTRRMQAWLAESGENRRLFEETRQAWEAARQLPPEPFDVGAGWNRLDRHIAEPAKVHRLRVRWWAAAAILPLLALGGYWWMKDAGGGWVAYSARHAVKDSLRLPDGSDIFLRPGAALQYRMTGNKRTVRLSAGEAFFRIRPDAQRQFSVQLPKGTVRVLGTSFNVSTTKGFSDIAVWEGKVSVEGDGKTVVLTAGDMAVVDAATGAVEQPEGNFAYRCGWGNSDLSFSHQPLQVVLETLAAYYHVRLESKDEQLLAGRITVRFRQMPLGEALAVLAEMLDLRVERRSADHFELIRK